MVLFPGGRGPFCRGIGGTGDQAGLGDAHFEAGAVGHGQVRGTAVDRIDEWYPAFIAVGNCPQVEAGSSSERVYGSGTATLSFEICEPAAESFKPIVAVEPEKVGDTMPFEHPRVDLPFVASQHEAARSGIAASRQGGAESSRFELAKRNVGDRPFVSQALIGVEIKRSGQQGAAEENGAATDHAMCPGGGQPAAAQSADR